MEKTLIKLLQEFLAENDIKKINNYFATDFCDEYNDEKETVLDYLTEEFYTIDIMIHDGKDVESKIRDVLNTAIEMLETT